MPFFSSARLLYLAMVIVLAGAYGTGDCNADEPDDGESDELPNVSLLLDIAEKPLGREWNAWEFIAHGVVEFTSRKQLVSFSESALLAMGEGDALQISQTIAHEVERKMSFDDRKLVYIRMSTGGPPFGSLRKFIDGGVLYYEIVEPPFPSELTGLKVYSHLYSVPRNLKVKTTKSVPHVPQVDEMDLWDAVRFGEVNRVRKLLTTVVPKGKKNKSTIVVAAGKGFVEITKLLLATEAIGETEYCLAVHRAAEFGHTAVLRTLLHERSERAKKALGFIKNTRQSPLCIACRNGHSNAARYLVVRGADVEQQVGNGERPIHDASLSGNAYIVQLLLDAGANATLPSNYGLLPIHNAAKSGDVDCIQLLLNAGADLEPRKKTNLYSLTAACGNGHVKAVNLMLSKGADPMHCNLSGEGPLHYAARSGNPELICLLLDAGVDVDASSNQGLRPLHLAARHDHREFALELLRAGANPKLTHEDTLGDHPVSVLQEAETDEMRKLIQEHLAH